MNKRNTHEAGKKKRKYPAKLAKDKIKLGEGEREAPSRLQGGGGEEKDRQNSGNQSTPAMCQTLGEGGRWRRGMYSYKGLEMGRDERRGLNL